LSGSQEAGCPGAELGIRPVQRIQKTIISELNKIAIIHLYAHGFTDAQLLDFELSLTNPSTLAQQQKLELIKSQFEIAGMAMTTDLHEAEGS